nr:signal recognition particle receptor subunit alpha [Nitrospirota bacterium]
MEWLARLSQGLAKTRERVKDSLTRLVTRGPDPAVLEELEETLIAADLGVHMVQRLIERLQAERARLTSSGPGESQILAVLKGTLLETLQRCEGRPLEALVRQGPKPYVLLAVG